MRGENNNNKRTTTTTIVNTAAESEKGNKLIHFRYHFDISNFASEIPWTTTITTTTTTTSIIWFTTKNKSFITNALWSRMENKHRINSHLIIHCSTSEEVSEMSERANEGAQRGARAKRAVRSKQTSEQCEQTSEWTSEWPSTYVCILGYSGPQCSIIWFTTKNKSFITILAHGQPAMPIKQAKPAALWHRGITAECYA